MDFFYIKVLLFFKINFKFDSFCNDTNTAFTEVNKNAKRNVLISSPF